MAIEDETEAATPAAQKPVEREANALDPKTFDLAGWIDGVEPIEHAVKIYARGSLLAELDIIKGELDNAKLAKNYARVKELGEKAAEVIKSLEESALTVKVVAWSQDKIDAFMKPLKDAGMSDEDRVIEQVAAQVTEPAGFTADQYRTLLERVRPQAETIAGAVLAANTRVPVVSVPS